MTAVLAFLRLCWKPLLVLIISVAVWIAIHHYGEKRYTQGYQQAVSENGKALAA